MSNRTGVDRLYEEFTALIDYLDEGNEISLKSSANETFRKSLLMASASYFEFQLISQINDFFDLISHGNELAIAFVRAKAINRQYHTYFNWKEKNINSFFGLFGDGFSKFMKKQVQEDEELHQAISAFLEIGRDRNRLVHEDFATFPLEKSSQEIYETYKTAIKFVEAFPIKLQEYMLEIQASNCE